VIDPTTGQLEGDTDKSSVPGSRWDYGYSTGVFPYRDAALLYIHGYAGDTVAAGQIYDKSVMKVGDLVSLTVPGGGQNVFEFDPTIADANWTQVGSETSPDYIPNFVSMSGSGATLKLIADPS